MKTALVKIVVSFLAIGGSCIASANLAGGADSYWISRTHNNLNKIENYSATIEQTHSSSPDKILSQVQFTKPNNFHLLVSKPSYLKGFEVGFNEKTILLHNPISNNAIKLEGLKSPAASNTLEQVKRIYDYNLANYEHVFTPSINIAERLSVGLNFVAKDAKAEIVNLNSFSDYHYSMFMQADYSFRSGATTKLTHSTMRFNQDNISLSTLEVPDNTELLYWDFSDASLSDKQAKERISTDIRWPIDTDNTWGFGQHQFYQHTNAQTAAAYFYNDAFFMIALTEPAKTKKELIQGTHLTLNQTPVEFSQWPAFSHLTFELDSINYTLISNIHPQGLIDMAQGMLSQHTSGNQFYLTRE